MLTGIICLNPNNVHRSKYENSGDTDSMFKKY